MKSENFGSDWLLNLVIVIANSDCDNRWLRVDRITDLLKRNGTTLPGLAEGESLNYENTDLVWAELSRTLDEIFLIAESDKIFIDNFVVERSEGIDFKDNYKQKAYRFSWILGENSKLPKNIMVEIRKRKIDEGFSGLRQMSAGFIGIIRVLKMIENGELEDSSQRLNLILGLQELNSRFGTEIETLEDYVYMKV